MMTPMEEHRWQNEKLAFWLAPLLSTIPLIPFFSLPSSPLYLGKLMGDPAHPFTRGVLCAKVNGYLAYAQSPDRLLYPLRRRGPKGRGEFERISWDDAIDEIAERFSATIREFGPEAIWPYLGSGSM